MNKIVKKVAALTLAGTMVATMVSCAKNNTITAGDIKDDIKYETITDENGNEIWVDSNGNVDEKEPENMTQEENTEKQESIKYSPLDFSTVSNFQDKYDELIKSRGEYFSNMQTVLKFKSFHSQEEIKDVIYNIVRIDSDLSNLLVKIYEQTKEDVKDDIYLADQIEKLEKVLTNMKDLRDKIMEAESEYSTSLDDVTTTDAEQIQRISKYSLLPLKSPIKKMEKEIENLKEDLEEALANQQ